MTDAQRFTYTIARAAGIDRARAMLDGLPAQQDINRAAARTAIRRAIKDLTDGTYLDDR